MGNVELQAGLAEFMHEFCLYQNTGFPDIHGRDAALAQMDYYLDISGMPFGRAELIGIAATGNLVLTERIDHLYDAARTKTDSAHIMGAFEIEDGKIKRYSDYLDPRPFLQQME